MPKTRKHFYLLMPAFLISALVFAVTANLFCINAFADDGSDDDDDAHIISFYENGRQTNVRSDADTVREALERANISINEGDRVEPGLDEEILSDSFNINIYRARDVIVIDGKTRKHIKTASTNPSDIATDAGFKLLDADVVELERFDGFLESGNTVAYKIKRAKTVHVDFYGKKLDLRTQAKSVAKFLADQEIDTNSEKNWISVALTERISDGMSINIQPQGIQTITVDEEIAFGESVTQDFDLAYGKREVTKAGENGQKIVTYEVNMHDGVELSRVKISEIIVKEPVNQEVRVGKKVNLPSGSHEDWMAAAGISPSDYGYVNYIISHESSWRPDATNGTYYGLYQTKPARLVADCGNDWVNDPICQLRSATGYAVGRYGSWEAAYNVWVSKGWW